MTRENEAELSAAQWDRVSERFNAIADLSGAEREQALAVWIEPDAAVRRVVERLLAQDEEPAALLDSDVGGVIGQLFDHTDDSALPRTPFGPYRATRVLGQGGMGVVYLAERSDIGARVALKVLWASALSSTLRARFEAEQRILAALKHPGIVPLYDAGVQPDGTPWFAMEYVEGESLLAYSRRHSLSVEARLRLFQDVCDAVRAAHQQLVVHGDIKPSNIMTDAGGRVRLLDFGVADRLNDTEPTAQSTRRLTPAYAAPERRSGAPPTVLQDVFALGVTLHQLLTDRLPQFGPSHAFHFERPTASTTDWSDLEAICRTAMQSDPARRYASVEALQRDIAHYQRFKPLETRDATLGYRAGKFVRRQRTALALTAAVVAMLAVTGIVSWVRVSGATARATAEAVRTAQIQRFVLSLLSGGDDVAGPPDSLRVSTLLERGVREAEALNDDPVTQAALLHTLGGALRGIGKLSSADSVLQRALTLRAGQGDAATEGATLGELALLHADAARFDSARHYAARARRTSAQGDAGIRAEATALEVEGKVYELAGVSDSALLSLRQAVALRVQSRDTTTQAFAQLLVHVANNAQYAGQLDSAEAVNQRILSLAPEILPKGHPMRGDALINLGSIARDLGKDTLAVDYASRGAVLVQAWYGPDHHATASAWAELARAQIRVGRYDEADSLIRRALVVRERVYGPNHPRVANLYGDLANLASSRDREAEAVELYKRVIEIYRNVYNGKHYLIGLFQGNMATSLTQLKKPGLAERELRAGLAMYAQTLPPDHLNFAVHRIKLGRALIEQRRFREAVPELLSGYDLVQRQTTPPAPYLRSARNLLVKAYTGLGDSTAVRRYRGELEAAAAAK